MQPVSYGQLPLEPRVRVVRGKSIVRTDWFCSPACAGDEPGLTEPVAVPRGRRCRACNRRVGAA